MTVSIPSMRPFATLTPRAIVEPSKEKTAVSCADAEARGLVVAIARGDEMAFARLYERYHRRLLRLALMVGRGDESLAHDAVQAAFVVAAKKLRRVQSEEHLWNWLAQVARQQIARAGRQQQSNPATVNAEDLIERAVPVEADFRLEEILDTALLSLELAEREIIERFYFERLSHKELAWQLNLTPKAVSSRLERARGKLRALIARALSHET
jgi:RNA polymerase sigma-70 factor (ECF subfamily)